MPHFSHITFKLKTPNTQINDNNKICHTECLVILGGRCSNEIKEVNDDISVLFLDGSIPKFEKYEFNYKQLVEIEEEMQENIEENIN